MDLFFRIFAKWLVKKNNKFRKPMKKYLQPTHEEEKIKKYLGITD